MDRMETKIFVPPIKIQGIKTKMVSFIKENVILPENAVWVEPFMGSGVVGFNKREKSCLKETMPIIMKCASVLTRATAPLTFCF